MEYMKIYEQWCENKYFDEAFRNELKALKPEEIEEIFFKDLEFGTAGLRGILGAGRNRMNKYIIRRATQGYANYLLSKDPVDASCAIAHDNRHFSDEFTKEAACVLAANGIKTHIFDSMRSTPELSFAVRELGTTGGIVITASHNPKEYNGYKVYDSTGGQLVPHEADILTKMVEDVVDFGMIKYMNFEEAFQKGMIDYIDNSMDDKFLDAISVQQIHPESYQVPMNIVYSPMHGVGGQIMPKLFQRLGVTDIFPHPQQMIKDPDFSTVYKPNPEEEGAFEKSMEYGREVDAELLIATDPDSDRVSIVVRDAEGQYVQLNGNEIGSLFTYYVLSESKLPENPMLVKTVVTGDMPFAIADAYGVGYEETLTGFKFIGDKINQYEREGKNFLLGYEEAIGFLIGKHARDKDGVCAAMMAIEMAKYYKSKGMNLLEVLELMYQKFGYYTAETVSVVYPGMEGMNTISKLMGGFRDGFQAYISSSDFGLKLKKILDFKTLTRFEIATQQEHPMEGVKSNVLKYFFENGDWICVRPSGTEPKIKFYYCVCAKTSEAAQENVNRLKDIVNVFAKQILKK